MWFTIGLMLGAICGLIVCSCAMVSQITSLENMIAAQKTEIMDLKNKGIKNICMMILMKQNN